MMRPSVLRTIARPAFPRTVLRSNASLRLFSRSTPAFNAYTPGPALMLSEDEEMMRDAVEKFATEVVKPRSLAMDEAEAMDKDVITALFENGLMGIETPAEYGGSEASFTSAIVAIEELARADPSVSVCCDVHNTLVNTLIRVHGSQELKEKYLPKLATETLGAFCLSEPSSGSDAFALKATAKKTADGDYILNGGKMWITNSAEADVFLIFANLDPSKGYKGITCFLAEKSMGVQIAKKEKKLGIRASSTCVINFDDMHVPKENLVGEEGQGYKYAIEILNEGRIGIAAQMIGLARGAFDMAINYGINERKQFGKYIGENQGMQYQYAEAAMQIEAARLLTYNAARLKEANKPFIKEAAMAKLYASRVAQSVASSAVDWMGGVGFTREMPAEKLYRDAKIGSIYEGTSNIQLDTIFRYLKREYVKQ
ncbi:acyl-CoA dehydrogenase NM domain-like protein [Saitoella complicata NRRL Y-17804]|uniref:acyl-CoA dehydrogenase NM domain-like protein n=1 Tax=Saitoella complicata (strain BCRC 22490 / CBS 7301 / JCM 7358 / NBRC 10748 / NRRL Y-17804) TaxID=698492 RepID=UPI00086738C9|nr:acyl-CoA dehydrogenase NM domain-like protein [Saitoella complicata NRRL Y-17804]ODQ55412.1 acyl-CoA dehydrogenase NM domain-like protein [Saitoella complicata NRRL Y-17804]